MKAKTDLSKYDNDWYEPGKGKVLRLLWYITNALVFNSYWIPISSVKVKILRLFGAKVGPGCVIKPKVNIKYPWKLSIGAYSWIGECVWIDNLEKVRIGPHSCLSQGAMLLCGNHNYKSITFDLIVGGITLEEGCWVGAKSIVAPGVTMKSHSVLSAMSLATREVEAYSIYSGVPAKFVKHREINT